MDSWQEQAKEISTAAGILAGGDGSARKKKGVIKTVLASQRRSRRLSIGQTRRQATCKFCAPVAAAAQWINCENRPKMEQEVQVLSKPRASGAVVNTEDIEL